MDRPEEHSRTGPTAERREFVIGMLALPAAAGIGGATIAAEPALPGTVRPSRNELYQGRIDGFENKTLAEKIQELIDREEYRELTAIYALRVANGVSTADLFVDDGIFTVEQPGQPLHIAGGSRAALDKNMNASALVPEHPLPQIHNYLIKVDGDNATGICSNELRRTEDGKSMIGSGWYSDVLRRENGRWRFVRRDMRFRHYVPLEEGWAATSP